MRQSKAGYRRWPAILRETGRRDLTATVPRLNSGSQLTTKPAAQSGTRIPMQTLAPTRSQLGNLCENNSSVVSAGKNRTKAKRIHYASVIRLSKCTLDTGNDLSLWKTLSASCKMPHACIFRTRISEKENAHTPVCVAALSVVTPEGLGMFTAGIPPEAEQCSDCVGSLQPGCSMFIGLVSNETKHVNFVWT